MRTTPRELFVDTTVLAYAVGGPHEHRTACARLVHRAADADLTLHASAEAIAELVFHRMRRGPRAAAIETASLARQMLVVHAFDADVLDRALELIASTPLRSRDAVHAATALAAGFDSIVTTDADFASIPILRAVHPKDC